MTTSTPNTPANGGQIRTWQDRMESHNSTNRTFKTKQGLLMRPDEAMKAEIADLRAALAAPAIPTVDRNAVLYRFKRINKGVVMAEGIGVHAVSMDDAIEKAQKLMEHGDRIEFESNRLCVRKCGICAPGAPAAAQPAAQGAVSGLTLVPSHRLASALNSLRWTLNKSDECDSPNMRACTLLDKHHSKDGHTVRADLEYLWSAFRPVSDELTSLLLHGDPVTQAEQSTNKTEEGK